MATFNIDHSSIHTIIFDFDGTLAKLNIDFQEMRNAIMSIVLSHGLSKDEIHTPFVLEMIDSAFAILMERSEKQARRFLNEANTIIENIEIEAAAQGELFADTKRLLTYLQSNEFSCGIITRNCAKAVKIVFPEILSYCPIVICRDDVNHVKPHPEHIRLALTRLGSSASDTLMIGDHPIDIKTGHDAGTKTCGVLTGRCMEIDFIEAGADIILPQAADLLRIIK
ncbi:MAG TPA: HAD-IA family hydrolase [Smithella sp.]|nr:HAD-IA family hydrolase [Smithella sp.]HOU49990.1 HAD-IA family hydrolase [Smithella sp.]HQG66269.1 HAD-IA family hydrolase [Smithella sp.]HQH17799.1 HAD-IA family hydrolase [Smithella sp.]HQI72038.1 HAD-IA family hydrolase [Smithella sp.]